MIKVIKRNEIDIVWDSASKALNKAFKQCLHDSAELHYPNLIVGKEQLWQINDNTWGITRFIPHEDGLIFHHVAVGGENIKDDIYAYIDTTENLARLIGCKKILVNGRLGWQKYLPDYKAIRIILEKEL